MSDEPRRGFLRRWVAPEAKRTEYTVALYRQAFGTPQGRIVLGWLLERCGFGRRVENEEQRVLHNWGIDLLENMGLTQGPNYKALVDSLLLQGVPEEAIDRGEDNGRRG